MNSELQQSKKSIETEQQKERIRKLVENQTVATPPELKDRYRFLGNLGTGSQGSVFKAERLSDNKIVAIKRLRIDSVNTWKEYDLFQREAAVLSTISEHGVAEFYEAIECLKANPPAAYIVQELIEGRSVQIMLKTGFRFTISRIFQMALGIVNLLERLHTHNPPIIHRDIKPNNIIMKPLADAGNFDPYLIDFGAVANPTVQKGGSTVAGTYGYMPPEQLIGRPCPASDIYALGATIVYMLCGVEPAEMLVSDFRLVIDPHLENVPRPVVTVLHQMLDPKPETRLCDYDTLRSIFTKFSNDDYQIEQVQQSIDEKLIDEKLKKVNAFNQAGNLDLWMQLPEKTPRKVPHSVSNTILCTTTISEMERQGNVGIKRDFFSFIGPNIGFVILGIIIFIIAVVSTFEDYSLFWGCVFGSIFVVGTIVFTLMKIHKAIEKNRTSKFLERKVRDFDMAEDIKAIRGACGWDDIDNAPLLTLLKIGRRAIATIVDFEDFPVPEKWRQANPEKRTVFSIYRVPFRLRYRFNPPDDASEDDLVHEIIIYNHQTEGLEPGTPIPILYYIDPKDNSDVISMPYPFPFREIQDSQSMFLNKDNLYGHTKVISMPYSFPFREIQDSQSMF